MERLQKAIADAGYTSRRKAEELIINGKVQVNGKIVTKLGTKVTTNDDIVVEGKLLKKASKVHYLFYKPRGVISSTSDDKGRKTIIDYFDTNKRLYPVGRLDYDASGIIMVTNDGEFANYIMHPSNNITKTYIVKLNGIINGEAINKLKMGIILDNSKSIALRVKLKQKNQQKNTSLVEIVIQEGKNHQIKRMFEAVGYSVLKLKREKIAFLDLKGLRSGQYREITKKELKQLYKKD